MSSAVTVPTCPLDSQLLMLLFGAEESGTLACDSWGHKPNAVLCSLPLLLLSRGGGRWCYVPSVPCHLFLRRIRGARSRRVKTSVRRAAQIPRDARPAASSTFIYWFDGTPDYYLCTQPLCHLFFLPRRSRARRCFARLDFFFLVRGTLQLQLRLSVFLFVRATGRATQSHRTWKRRGFPERNGPVPVPASISL